jgi:hypothetical protein
VIGTPTSSTDYKSAAHAILSDWYVKRGSNPIFSRYFYMACHHAEAAIRIAEAVSPRDYTASPSVLFFLANVYRKLSTEWDAPEALVMYKRCYHALKLRDAQVSGKQRKAEVKRLKQPNRYRCANSGCGIVADKGRMFSRCELSMSCRCSSAYRQRAPRCGQVRRGQEAELLRQGVPEGGLAEPQAVLQAGHAVLCNRRRGTARAASRERDEWEHRHPRRRACVVVVDDERGGTAIYSRRSLWGRWPWQHLSEPGLGGALGDLSIVSLYEVWHAMQSENT